jgi:hypothetical protein
MANELILSLDNIFRPDVDSVAIPSPTGNEKFYTQDANGNYFMTAFQIAAFGKNVAVSANDTTPGTLSGKLDSSSPFKIGIINPNNDERYQIVMNTRVLSGSNINLASTEGFYRLDTGTHGTGYAGYTNLPEKLDLVKDYLDTRNILVEVKVWGESEGVTSDDKIMQIMRVVLDIPSSTNTVVTLTFIRTFKNSAWSAWVETSATDFVLDANDKDLDNYVYDGTYAFVMDGGTGDYRDYSNLPATLPDGVVQANLYANFDAAYMDVKTTKRSALSRQVIQTLVIPYNAGGSTQVYTYKRHYLSSAWTDWYLVGSGSGGGGAYTTYDAGNGCFVTASNVGCVFFKNTTNGTYNLNVPLGVELRSGWVNGTTGDGDSNNDIYFIINHDSSVIFNKTMDNAKVPIFRIQNNISAGSISRSTPAFMNNTLVQGVSSVTSGNIEVKLVDAETLFPDFKVIFLMP